jgi:hypothetical protein
MPSKTAQTVAAGSVVGIGSFQGFLAFWDWLTAGDSLLSIYNHLPDIFRYLNHPASSTIIVLLGLVLLWWATRDSPKPVVLYGANYHVPLPAKRHPIVRIGLISVGCAAVGAITYAAYHYRFTSRAGATYVERAQPEKQTPSTNPIEPPAKQKPPVPKIRGKTADTVKSTTVPKSESKSVSTASGSPPMPGTDSAKVVVTRSNDSIDDAAIARSIPRGLIPQDPIQAVAAVERMRRGIKDAIQNKETITFLVSWPMDDNALLVFIDNLLSSACRDTPRQCWFVSASEANTRDLDKPPVHGSSRRGITVHGPDANVLAAALSNWFETYVTTRVPSELTGYKSQETKYLIWIDIGPGSPWKQ